MAIDRTDEATAEPKKKTIEGQLDDSPEGWARYWQIEFKSARMEGSDEWTGIDRFRERGNRIVRRYRASQKGARPTDSRLNVFAANIQTQRAILVGQTPKCEVTRRYEDQGDDDARIAATMLERILNQGLEEESRGFASVISRCTEDRLLPGMCGARVQFSADFETVPEQPAITGPCPCSAQAPMAPPMPGMPSAPPPGPDANMAPPPAQGEPSIAPPPVPGAPNPACPMCGGSGVRELAPAVPSQEKPTNETAEASYVNWRDQLWSVARTFEEVRWWAFSAEMSRKQLKELFGDEEGSKIQVGTAKKSAEKDARKETPWHRARVWEIWSREYKRLFWYVEGHPRVIFPMDNANGEDPLGLDDFWPFPAPMMANATTDAYLPTPDFDYAKDLYDEADELTNRIRNIVRAIKVVGCYDKNSQALRRVLDEACELEMIPIANFGEFLKGGGMHGALDFLPIQEMVQTVQALVQERNIVIESIYQITGLSDIIRGQQQQSETATTSAIKARYASVRLQDLQKDVARYATDLQRLRKEIIAKQWSIETIIDRSAIMQSGDGQDPQRIMRAAQLIKDKHLDFRVVIKPEQISLQDWAQLKQQRSEVLQAIGLYFQSMMPFLQMASQAGPGGIKSAMKLVLQNAQWLVAGMPGASGVESAFDAFVVEVEKMAEQAAQQPPQPPPPDPKVQAQTIKAQGDIAKTQAATQGRILTVKAETQAAMATREHDARMDVLTDQAKSEARLRLDAMRSVAAVTGPVVGGVR
jgi:hypothetical protein